MSENRALARAALVVSAGILLSRLLGFLRDVAILAFLGRTRAADLYTDAFLVPDFLFFLMAGGYLSITLVPILSRHHAAGDDEAARRSFTAVFRLVSVLMALLTVVLMMAARPLTGLVFGELQPAAVAHLTRLMRIGLASQVFFVMGTILMAAQYARQRFVVPTLAPIIYNTGIIVGGAIGALLGHVTPDAFLWGGLGGAVLGNFALQWWGARRVGMRLTGGVPVLHPAIREYFTLAFPLMIGQSVVALDEQFPRLFGQFAGAGDTAGLLAARKLNMLPVGMIAQAAGVAAFPFLAKLFAEGRGVDLRRTVATSVRTALAIAGVATAVMIPLAEPIVRSAYQWGAFGAADTRAVAPLLAIYAVSIPFWSAHQIYTRAFYAQRRMWLPVLIGSSVTALAIPAYLWAVHRIGARGIALTSTVSVATYTVGVALAWHLGGTRDEAGSVARTAARVGAAGVLAGLAAFGASAGLDRLHVQGGALTILLVGVIVAAGIYLVAARLVGLGEVRSLARRLRPRAAAAELPGQPGGR